MASYTSTVSAADRSQITRWRIREDVPKGWRKVVPVIRVPAGSRPMIVVWPSVNRGSHVQ